VAGRSTQSLGFTLIIATLTVDDYIAGHRLHYAKARGNIYGAAALLTVVGVAIAISGVRWAPIVLFAGIGGLVGNWWADRFGLPTKVRKLYDQFKGIGDPVELSWDSEQIEARSARGHGARKWRDYARFAESEEVFLLYATDQLWYAFPKRWFTDQKQLEEFRIYARTAGET
jgi:YcxB-like protein